MRVVVIGLGSIGTRHAKNLAVLGHEAVTIDSDPTRGQHRKLSMHCGTLDAAIIATPAETHLGLLRECIAWGLPVLVEKPLGLVGNLPMLRALRPTKPVMVGYQLRFHPEVRRIQPLLSKAAAGILQCRCDSRTWPGSAGRGDFLSEFSHEIDLALHCGSGTHIDYAWSNTHEVELRLAQFRVSLSDRAEGYTRRWEFFDQPRGSYGVQVKSPADLESTYIDELAHFLCAVEGGPIAPGCALEEGIAVLEVIQQVQR